MSNVIEIRNLSKIYRLGEIGTGTITRDLERWYAMKIRGQSDPFLKIGETNERGKKGKSDIVYSLRDINFEVQQGDALGIIGKNGAGKSTLLKILSRVTSPTTGKIKIKGRVASLLEVGTGFHPELSGHENIYLNGAILGMRKKEITRKLDEIIDFSGVERYIDTPVKRYSTGMYVRLAFAVAAHLESEILIIDEVLAVGDAEFQKKCLGKMDDIRKGEGRTVLFVSHNLGSIKQLCSTGILLQNGIATLYDDIQQLIIKYQNTSIEFSRENVIKLEHFGIIFNNLMINDIIAGSTPDLFSGDKIRIEISYVSKKTGFEICIGYGIRNFKDGVLVVFTHNHLENYRPRIDLEGNISTVLNVPKFAPGKYLLEMSVWLDGTYVLQEREIANFNIIPTPSFRSKSTFVSFPSLVLINSTWEFQGK